jgi:type IV pilus assembly protein PilB
MPDKNNRDKNNNVENGGDLGATLLQGAFITEAELKTAQEIASRTNRKLSEVLLEQGLIDSEVLGSILSLKYGVPVVNLARVEVQPEAIALVPEQVAREHRVLPVSLNGDTLTVATEDPHDFRTVNTLASLTRKRIVTVIPVGMRLEKAIDGNYKLTSQIEQQVSQIVGLKVETETAELTEAEVLKQAPVVQAVDMMLTQAVRDGLRIYT